MIVVDDRFCPQNHACPAVRACPEGAMTQDGISAAPRINHDLCTACGVCTGLCRVFALMRDD